MRRVEGVLEIQDGPLPAADRRATLADIGRLSAWFGGHALTLGALRRAAPLAAASRPLIVVDVGGGRGDFARWLIRRARRLPRPLRIVVVDRDPDLLAEAAVERSVDPAVTLVRADVRALPFREGSVDMVTMSLTLHHLAPDAAARALAEMRTAARLAVIVNDLLRTRLSLVLVWLATRVLGCHRVSRHDGPLSVRRAYSPGELGELAARAGIGRLRVTRHPWRGRVLAVIEP